MWLGKLVSSPLVTCCGTGTNDSAVAAFTRLLNDWIARGFVTPSGGGTLPGLPDPRVPPNCAEAVLELTRTPAARVAATPTRSRNSRRCFALAWDISLDHCRRQPLSPLRHRAAQKRVKMTTSLAFTQFRVPSFDSRSIDIQGRAVTRTNKVGVLFRRTAICPLGKSLLKLSGIFLCRPGSISALRLLLQF